MAEDPKIEAEVKNVVKLEEDKMEVMEEILLTPEEEKAFKVMSSDNKWILNTISDLKGKKRKSQNKILASLGLANEILKGRERRKHNSRRHELAVHTSDNIMFMDIDNPLKEKAWDKYIEDRKHKRKWNIIYKLGIAVIGIAAYMLGGYPMMFQYIHKFAGG